MERRHVRRAEVNVRESLQRALGSWQCLAQAWTSVRRVAEAARNLERVALAEAKLDQCRGEISRLEARIDGPSG